MNQRTCEYCDGFGCEECTCESCGDFLGEFEEKCAGCIELEELEDDGDF